MKTLKKWQLNELKRLLSIKREGAKKDVCKIHQSFEVSFPEFKIVEPLKLWSSAAKEINERLNSIEELIRDLILSKSKSDWDLKSARFYQTRNQK